MRLKIFPVIALVLITLVACKKEKTNWGSSWRAPLFQDTVGFSSLIDSNKITVESDNSLRLTLEESLLKLDLFEFLNLPDTSVVQNYNLPFSSLSVNAGASFVNDIQEFVFDLGDVQLSDIIIARGEAKVIIENPIDEPAIFNISLPGVTKNGVEFSQVKTIPPAVNGVNGRNELVFDFTDYHLNLRGEDGNSFNKLQSQMLVSTDPGGNDVVVTNQDVFKFTLDISELEVKYAKGYFGQINLSDTISYDVQELANLVDGTIDIDDVTIDFRVRNGVNVNGEINLSKLSSENIDGNIVQLQSAQINTAQSVNAAQSTFNTTQPSNAFYNFTSLNSNIEDFIENLGYRYEVGYNVSINPWGNTSGGYDEIFEGAVIDLALITDIPLRIAMNDLHYRDTIEFDVQQNFDGNHVKSGDFILNVKNSFPFGGSFSLSLLGENNNVLTTISSEESILPAYTETTTSINSFPQVENNLIFSLTENDVIQLNNASQIVIDFKVSGASNTLQTVYKESELILQLLTDFQFQHAL